MLPCDGDAGIDLAELVSSASYCWPSRASWLAPHSDWPRLLLLWPAHWQRCQHQWTRRNDHSAGAHCDNGRNGQHHPPSSRPLRFDRGVEWLWGRSTSVTMPTSVAYPTHRYKQLRRHLSTLCVPEVASCSPLGASEDSISFPQPPCVGADAMHYGAGSSNCPSVKCEMHL